MLRDLTFLTEDLFLNHVATSTELFGKENLPSIIGREDELKTIWNTINSKQTPTQKTPLYYFHGSPGMGKTYIFRHLVDHNKEPDVVFLAIDFNRNSMREIILLPSIKFTPSSLVPLLRLFYVNFIDENKFLWESFIKNIDEYLNPNENKHLANDLILGIVEFIREKCLNKKVILLVDELTKADVLDCEKDGKIISFTDLYRSSICRFADPGSIKICDMVFFSTLDAGLIGREQSESSRPIIPIIKLPMFTNEESKMFLQSLQCDFYSDTGVLLKKNEMISLLADISGGHPRTLFFMFDSFSDKNRIDSISTILVEIAKKLSFCENPPNWVQLISYVFKGEAKDKKVKITTKLESGEIFEETLESMLNRGILLGSVAHNESHFIPMLPELHLRWWCKFGSRHDDMRKVLNRLLDSRLNFSAKRFESFHVNWELLMRYIRSEIANEYSEIQSFYPTIHDKHRIISKIFHILSDGCTPLTTFEYISGENILLQPNTCFIPNSDVQPGWDSLILLSVQPQSSHKENKKSYVLPCFIQNKYSKTTSTTKISSATIKESLENCRNFFNNHIKSSTDHKLLPKKWRWTNMREYFKTHTIDQFILIFVASADCNKNVRREADKNVLTLFRDELSEIYGPTLTKILISLDTTVVYVENPLK